MNNYSISSTHAERKITICSHKHSFTPYPSLSSYSWTDRITDRETNTLTAHGLEELFSSCAAVSVFFVVAGNRCRCYLPTIPVVQLCLVAQISFLVVVGKSVRCYLLTNHTSCAIVVGIVFGCTVSKKD